MLRKVSQSTLRVHKNRMQRYSGHFFRDLAAGALIILATLMVTSGLIFFYSYILSDPYFIEERYGRVVDMVIDGGKLMPEPSSIISLVDDQIEIIRMGKGDVSSFQ